MGKGLYLHIPFCRKKCLYCCFYSIEYSEGMADLYVSAILKQLKEPDQNFSSAYIGGGTPSILSIDLLDKLLTSLSALVKDNAEFTIEVNPESVDKERLGLFIEKGINRISIGVQSFDDKKLKILGRQHNAAQALKAIELSKKAGFNNINIDMMFGVSGEDLKAWQSELAKAAVSGVQHISCYSLSYEKDTPFFKMKEEKAVAPLDDETLADMYGCAVSYLSRMGFERYEVSNFSKPGFRCMHNLNYWDNNSYIGIGPSAVSYIDGVRSENIRGVKEYINRHEKNIDLNISMEELLPVQRAKETAAIKIRTKDGINYDWFKNQTGFDFLETEKEALERLMEQGLIEYDKKDIRLTDKGFLFADTVSAGFL